MTSSTVNPRASLALRDAIGIGAIAVLLVTNTLLNYSNTQVLSSEAQWVAHTYEVKNALSEVLVCAASTQSSVRAFVSSRDEALLDNYRKGLVDLPRLMGTVSALTQDNAPQQQRVKSLLASTHELLTFLDAKVNAQRTTEGELGARFTSSEGDRLMDTLREQLSSMTTAEDLLLRERELRRARTYQMSIYTGVAAGVVSLVMLFLFVRNLMQGNRERARAVATAFEQEQWFRTTLNSIGDAVMATDADGRVIYSNHIAQKLTGWSADDAHGHPLEEVFHIVNEDTRKKVDNPVAKVQATGLIVGLANHTVLLAKDGEEYPIDDSAAPIRDAEGQLIGVVLVFHDVAEQREAVRALARSEGRKSSILRTALDCIITVDHEGRIVEFNPAAERTFGCKASDAVGRDLSKFISPAKPDNAQFGIARYIDQGEGSVLNRRVEMNAVRVNGQRFPVELAITPIPEQESAIFTAHVRDITERKRMENELRETAAHLSEADRRKSEFIAILAHELRNPLAPLRNALELITLSEGDTGTLNVAVPMMKRQLGQMVRLIDDLLDVTRISHGKISLQRQVIDLVQVVREAEEAARIPCQQSSQDLQVVLPDQPVYVNADGARMLQVFSNLLNNACKFTHRGGQVSITLKQENDEAVINVRDNGIGIAENEIARIFTLFSQVEDPLGRKQDGLGIGLSLVRLLVDMHGGRVTASSPGKDLGSEFEVRLPLAPTVTNASGTGDKAIGTNRPKRILVVDDNRDAAESLALLLRKHGHEVYEAYDGIHGVQEAAHRKPDVVLLDIGMPGLNGYEAAQRIRRIPGLEDIHLVALTGWGHDEDRQRSTAAGFNAHLTKPADNSKLLSLLAGISSAKAP